MQGFKKNIEMSANKANGGRRQFSSTAWMHGGMWQCAAVLHKLAGEAPSTPPPRILIGKTKKGWRRPLPDSKMVDPIPNTQLVKWRLLPHCGRFLKIAQSSVIIEREKNIWEVSREQEGGIY